MIKKYLTFLTIFSTSGIAYFRYSEHQRINSQIEELHKNGNLTQFLHKLNEEAAFSIDIVMDHWEKSFNQFDINNYRNLLCRQCQGKVLETCVGSNRNIRFYEPQTDLTILDWSEQMLAVADTKSSPVQNFKMVQADVAKMPFETSSFDTVIDTFGLQCAQNPTEALREMSRVCKKGGKIILMNTGLSSLTELHWLYHLQWGYKLIRSGLFTNRNWNKIVDQFNFDVVFKERKKGGKIYIHILVNTKSSEVITEKQLSQTFSGQPAQNPELKV